MSIQNTLDIIANSQNSTELQFSGQSQQAKQSSLYNFEEMLASFKNESKTEKSEESEVKAEITENVKDSDNEETKVEEKTEVKTEEKSKTAAKKTDADEKTESRGEETVLVKAEVVAEVKEEPVKKVLTEKDFSKINEIADQAEKSEDLLSVENQISLVKTAEFEKDDKSELRTEVPTSNNFAQLLSEAEEEMLPVNLEEMAANSEGETELNAKNPKSESKISKLDKDGKITVFDERTKAPAEKEDSTEKVEVKAKTELKVTGENTATITMEMAQDTQTDVLSLNNQSAASNGSNYQTMFTSQLQQAAPEFVKAGQIVLKDNNQGTINLVLHPDDLGNVKIHLSLDGKSVSAQITVATKEAMQVFKDNAETLREAFIKQGFENAQFDVSYGNNSGLGQNSEFNEQNDGRELYARKAYREFSVAEDSEFENFYENNLNSDNYSINIVA